MAGAGAGAGRGGHRLQRNGAIRTPGRCRRVWLHARSRHGRRPGTLTCCSTGAALRPKWRWWALQRGEPAGRDRRVDRLRGRTEAAVAALPHLLPPPGRMQRVPSSTQPLVIVDYAHTPDALAQALAAVQPLVRARGGKLWAVFGAGGDRDPGKRAPMGHARLLPPMPSSSPSDNPRTEDPQQIIETGGAGSLPPRAGCCWSRTVRLAIEAAVLQADASDVVLIAGKRTRGLPDRRCRKAPFSDVEQAGARSRAARRAGHEPDERAELGAAVSAQRSGAPAALRSRACRPTRARSRRAPLFVALRGERFDGHDYAQAAVDRGAVALLVERPSGPTCRRSLLPTASGPSGSARRSGAPRFRCRSSRWPGATARPPSRR